MVAWPSWEWKVGIPSPLSVREDGDGREGASERREGAGGAVSRLTALGLAVRGATTSRGGSSEFEREREGGAPSAYSRMTSVMPHWRASSHEVKPAGVVFAVNDVDVESGLAMSPVVVEVPAVLAEVLALGLGVIDSAI